MFQIMRLVSNWAIPFILLFIPLYGHLRGVKVYETFVEGAREGLITGFKIFPYLVAMFVGIAIVRDSRALEFLGTLFSPVFSLLGIPSQILPVAIMRPLSGSGTLAFISGIFSEYGPDSRLGLMASILMGSTETTFYVLFVYFGAIGIKRARYAPAVGLIADFAGFIAAVYICLVFFR